MNRLMVVNGRTHYFNHMEVIEEIKFDTDEKDQSYYNWFILDEESGVQTFSAFQFYDSDLKCFPSE